MLAASLLAATYGCRAAGEPPAPAANAGPGARGSVTVLAAASLTEAFEDVRAGLEASDPGLVVTYSFGSSAALVAQVQQGAPADVIATADTDTMRRLTGARLAEAPVTFARNRLEILVAPGNPKAVRALGDLARTDLRVVLADESAPAGRYAARALQGAGVAVKPVSKEVDVKAAVARVTSGEADASIVYATDVDAAAAKGQGVDIPDAQNVVAEYPIAVITETRNHAGAAAFVDSVVNGAGSAALRRRGFLPA